MIDDCKLLLKECVVENINCVKILGKTCVKT